MQRISLKEVQTVLMGIMAEVHRLAEFHHIPYYMLNGTMLGAVRHGGIIPWDDDMDIGVPYEYYDEFVKILSREMRSPYRILTHQNSPNIHYGYAKVEDATTLIDNVYLTCPLEEQIGVNLDIFPLYRCGKGYQWNRMMMWRKMIELRYVPSTSPAWIKRIIHDTLRFIIPFDKQYCIRKVCRILQQQTGEGYMVSIWGRYGAKREIIPASYFGIPTLIPFGEYMFYGVERPHEYLSHLYGPDHMQLPPEADRFTHNDIFYKR